ncbi:TetR/AcrR family transcriptional regulator [Streptomyces cyaneofuscatus]|uniref:TetR/AcrR family transcriptional regulator n=1 Tax=Streptomyces cyaneofuscatus TaxID=66883 RepID=UPI0036561F16
MPLPRFHRLADDRQGHILDVARGHFARHGPGAASYNKIIESAGVSKTAAYQYFDGKDDLLATVLDGVRDRLLAALGPWEPAASGPAFRARLEGGSRALLAHLHKHPEDLALADLAIGRSDEAQWLGWFEAVVGNGQALGLIRTDIDRSLLVAATAAVLRAADAWTLARLRSGDGQHAEQGADQAWLLLAALWSDGSDGNDGRETRDAH